MGMLEKKVPGAHVPGTHHGSSDGIEHLGISFQQRRTFVVSAVILLILLIFELLLGHSLIRFPEHFILLILVLLFDILLAALVGWLTAEPLAIFAYLRTVQKEQQTNSRVYTTLIAVKSLYETPSNPSNQPEQKDIREIAKEVQTHLLILGLPGAGKTMALRAAYQFPTFNHYWSLVREQQSIPVYVPLKDYEEYPG
jgi:hypothetical protein